MCLPFYFGGTEGSLICKMSRRMFPRLAISFRLGNGEVSQGCKLGELKKFQKPTAVLASQIKQAVGDSDRDTRERLQAHQGVKQLQTPNENVRLTSDVWTLY